MSKEINKSSPKRGIFMFLAFSLASASIGLFVAYWLLKTAKHFNWY